MELVHDGATWSLSNLLDIDDAVLMADGDSMLSRLVESCRDV